MSKQATIPTNLTVSTWHLVKAPVSIRLVHFETWNQLSLSATSNRYSNCPASSRVGLRLSTTESHDFFRKLGKALGYEMPRSKAQRKRWPLTIVKELRVRGQRGLRSRTDGILIKVMFGMDAMRAPGPAGKIVVRLTRRKALDLFKSLAPILGWELYEKEVRV